MDLGTTPTPFCISVISAELMKPPLPRQILPQKGDAPGPAYGPPRPRHAKLQLWPSGAGRRWGHHESAVNKPGSVEAAVCTEDPLNGMTLALLRQLAEASYSQKPLGIGK